MPDYRSTRPGTFPLIELENRSCPQTCNENEAFAPVNRQISTDLPDNPLSNSNTPQPVQQRMNVTMVSHRIGLIPAGHAPSNTNFAISTVISRRFMLTEEPPNDVDSRTNNASGRWPCHAKRSYQTGNTGCLPLKSANQRKHYPIPRRSLYFFQCRKNEPHYGSACIAQFTTFGSASLKSRK